MGMALKKMDDLDTVASDEARTRINYAQLLDYAFVIREIVGRDMPDGDVESLAKAILQITKGTADYKFTKQQVVSELQSTGQRSRVKAAELADAIFK